MKTSAREAALKALERCRRDNAWSGAVIDDFINKSELNKRDAALTTRLCLGVLQNSMLCDYYISCFCKKKLDPKVRDIIRLGVYQLLMLDKIPARAAVNETVSLCRTAGCEKASGLVNAVLRKISANRENLPALPEKGGVEYLSIKYSFPNWIVKRLIDERGYDFAEAFFAACNELPKLYIQINTLKVRAEDYIRALERAEIPYTVFDELPGCVMLEGGSVAELPGYEDGLFYVQDKAARMAAELSGVVAKDTVYDVCSAPGGKAFGTAIRMKGKGSILCGDIHDKKLTVVSSGAKRLGIDIIETRCGDARVYDSSLSQSFDVVIADVPCSGFGVIGKKPEIRYKAPETMEGLPDIQFDILSNVSRYVKPQGTLLYSTCTIFREENETVVERFLAENEQFEIEDGKMRTFYPNVDGTDGFFVAKLKRLR